MNHLILQFLTSVCMEKREDYHHHIEFPWHISIWKMTSTFLIQLLNLNILAKKIILTYWFIFEPLASAPK